MEYQNKDAEAYNQKLSKLLGSLQPQLPGSTLLYADIYTPLMDMINNPKKYGKLVKKFKENLKLWKENRFN